MERYFKLSFIFFMILCVSLSIAVSGSLAHSKDKPVVVRKKIEDGNKEDSELIRETEIGNTPKKLPPAPRSDLARPGDSEEIDSAVDEILVAETKSTYRKNYPYNPKGKVDPFEPLFKSTTQKEENITIGN